MPVNLQKTISYQNDIKVDSPKSQKKKMDPVKKGAIIGGSIEAITSGASLISAFILAKKTGRPLFSANLGNIAKYMAGIAFNIGTYTLLGAGIGKIVKVHQEKKAQAEENKLNKEV